MLKIIPKKQPISQEGLYNLQEFIEVLANKDVQAYGLCFVDRNGAIHSMSTADQKDWHKLNAAVDLLAARVKG